MPDFTKLSSHKMGDAEPPKLLPDGTYMGTIPSIPTFVEVKTKEGKTANKLVVPLRLTGVEKLDNEEELNDVPDNLSARRFPWATRDFFLDGGDKDSFFQLQSLIKSCGLEMGRELGEIIPEMVGKDVMIMVTKNTYQDKQTGEQKQGNRIGRVTGV